MGNIMKLCFCGVEISETDHMCKTCNTEKLRIAALPNAVKVEKCEHCMFVFDETNCKTCTQQTTQNLQ